MKKQFVYGIFIDDTRNAELVKCQLSNEIGKVNTIGYKNMRYDIDKVNFLFHKGLTCYLYRTNNTKPLDPMKALAGLYSPVDYNSGINSKALSQLIDSLEEKTFDVSKVFNIILCIGMIVIIGLVVYFYTDIAKAIESLKTVTTTTFSIPTTILP